MKNVQHSFSVLILPLLINVHVFPLYQMRLPSKPYSSLPIYSIGSTNTLPSERVGPMGQGLSVAGGLGPSAVGGAMAPPTVKIETTGALKRAGKVSGPTAAAAAAKCEKSSSSPQRHAIHKTMSK